MCVRLCSSFLAAFPSIQFILHRIVLLSPFRSASVIIPAPFLSISVFLARAIRSFWFCNSFSLISVPFGRLRAMLCVCTPSTYFHIMAINNGIKYNGLHAHTHTTAAWKVVTITIVVSFNFGVYLNCSQKLLLEIVF